MGRWLAERYAIPAKKRAGRHRIAARYCMTGRITVVRDQRLVPLLPSTDDRSPREQPWKGVLLERHLVQPSEIPEHEHPELCLHLQLSGEEDFEWWSGGHNALEHTQPGSLILIPPGTRDRLRWRGISERLIVSVNKGDLASLARELGTLQVPEFRARWSLKDQGFRQLVTAMGQEAKYEWPLGRLYADQLALGLKTRLLQIYSSAPVEIRTLKGGLSLPKLKRAMEYINANLAEDVHLKAIAKELDLSSSHFAHEFRNSTGQTPYQYLLEQRIAKAKQLLRMTDLPVQFVSGQAGFQSSVNFVRAFRQRTGYTPEAWRKSL